MRRPITAEDRRRSVEAVLRHYVAHGRFLRITAGQRRAILAGTAYGPSR